MCELALPLAPRLACAAPMVPPCVERGTALVLAAGVVTGMAGLKEWEEKAQKRVTARQGSVSG